MAKFFQLCYFLRVNSFYTTKTAVYALARIFPSANFLTYMGALMAIYGVTFALMQNEMRKLLSYHIISQVGYMVAAIGLGGAMGVNGGLAHALHHILYKSLLFMCAGAVIYSLGEERLSNLGGLARRMPLTTFTCVFASFSIAGLPLFNGFISKTIITEAAYYNHNYIVSLILKLATVGTWLSFLKFMYFGFLRKVELPFFLLQRAHKGRLTDGGVRQTIYYSGTEQMRQIPLTMSIPMFIIALLCFLTGVYPKLVLSILPYETGNIHFYSTHNLFIAAQVYLITLLVFSIFKEVFAPRKIVTLDFDYFYVKAAHLFIFFCKRLVATFDTVYTIGIMLLFRKVAYLFIQLCKKMITTFDTVYTTGIEKLIPYAREEWAISTESVSGEKIIKNGGGLVVQISGQASIFDREIIDGLVNRIARSTFRLSNKLRRIQVGRVQSYAAIMFFFLVILLFFFLVF